MQLTSEESDLLEKLKSLHIKYREETYKKYKRINPFLEDLFDWKERGEFWSQDKSITIYNSTTVLGDVHIGKNTFVGPYCVLDGTGKLTIGENCSIAMGCQIISHDTIKWSLSGGKSPYEYKEISIGDCCFLGANSIITKGITIGDHSVIAAGSVITKEVQPFSIFAGVPGKKIGKVIFDEKGSINLHYFQ